MICQAFCRIRLNASWKRALLGLLGPPGLVVQLLPGLLWQLGPLVRGLGLLVRLLLGLSVRRLLRLFGLPVRGLLGLPLRGLLEATRASDTWGLAVRGLLVLVSALVSGLLGHEGLSLAATARISISTSVRRTKTIRIIGIRIWTSQIQAKSSQNRIKIKSNQNQIKILIES